MNGSPSEGGIAKLLKELKARLDRKPETLDLLAEVLAEADELHGYSGSGMPWICLLCLSRSDIKLIHDDASPQQKSALLGDLVSVVEFLCKGLIQTLNNQTQIDKDNFRVEYILRRTIGELQARKDALDQKLVDGHKELARLQKDIEIQKTECSMLSAKLGAIREHFNEAMKGVRCCPPPATDAPPSAKRENDPPPIKIKPEYHLRRNNRASSPPRNSRAK